MKRSQLFILGSCTNKQDRKSYFILCAACLFRTLPDVLTTAYFPKAQCGIKYVKPDVEMNSALHKLLQQFNEMANPYGSTLMTISLCKTQMTFPMCSCVLIRAIKKPEILFKAAYIIFCLIKYFTSVNAVQRRSLIYFPISIYSKILKTKLTGFPKNNIQAVISKTGQIKTYL